MPELQRDNCRHRNIVPVGDGNWGRCTGCGDETFPLTAEAAGLCEGCGHYGNCICSARRHMNNASTETIR